MWLLDEAEREKISVKSLQAKLVTRILLETQKHVNLWIMICRGQTNWANVFRWLFFIGYVLRWGGYLGHDVIKIINFSAIQCKFKQCLNNCICRQRCCQIIIQYQICSGSSLILRILKSYWISYYKNLVFQICVNC